MKLLLSAYACEPSKGSEPGVGWNWAQALFRRGYNVHVITRSNNRVDIESVGKRQPNPCFHYHDLPKWARFWKYWPGGIYLYYLLWQVGAYQIAKQASRKREIRMRSTRNVCVVPSALLHGRTWHSLYLWARWGRGDNAQAVSRKHPLPRSIS